MQYLLHHMGPLCFSPQMLVPTHGFFFGGGGVWNGV